MRVKTMQHRSRIITNYAILQMALYCKWRYIANGAILQMKRYIANDAILQIAHILFKTRYFIKRAIL
jgi:hypothetical protein